MILKNKSFKENYLIEKLFLKSDLDDDELIWLIDNISEEAKKYLFSLSRKTADSVYSNRVYLRALIEFTNYCKRECIYCGINHYNKNVKRYRISKEEILLTCSKASDLGFKTFVLQGGEDPYFKDEIMVDIISSIKKLNPNCAITISVGERSFESYKLMKMAGADRYLLRHETMNKDLYKLLHKFSNLESRIECLKNLKKLKFQTGAGFMVGLLNYKTCDYVRDLRFLKTLKPEMVGVGPFISHKDTFLRNFKNGDISTTLLMLSLIRLLLPKVLLPATTAVSTIDPNGRKMALDVGCNVIMPNVTPCIQRKEYNLYDNKKITGAESAFEIEKIKKELESYGYICDMSRGDSKMTI